MATKKKSSTYDESKIQTLSALEQQVVMMTANYENRCHYCTAGHSMLMQMAKMPDDVIEALREGTPIADPKLEELRNFAADLLDARRREHTWMAYEPREQRDQCRRIDGLLQDAVESEFFGIDREAQVVAHRTEHEDRGLVVEQPQLLREARPRVDFFHHEVNDNQVGIGLFIFLETLFCSEGCF